MRFDWSAYRGNLEWLSSRTIYLTRHGSHAYGTNLPTSDLDVKGVAIPPRDYFHGYLLRFEQAESRDPDLVIYDVRKFFSLAADCNPNIIEVLHTDDSDRLVVMPLGEALLEVRDLFLSRKAKHTFSGYAAAQLKRIRTHHRWLLHPPTAAPTRAEFGLPESSLVSSDDRMAAEAAVQKQVEAWDVDLEPLSPSSRVAMQNHIAGFLAEMKIAADEKWNAAARTLGFSEHFIEVMKQERAYRARQREWEQFQEWQRSRNVARAALEAKWGYDTKHGMHLVRLMRMCREILTMGRVIVKRPDAEELLAIRHGAWTYDQLVEWAEREDAELEVLAKSSLLPHAPDRVALDRACQRIVEGALAGALV